MSEKMTLSERKRLAIIQAAIDEFQSAGFQGTSMDKVAARAQVSKRTVYNHFPSKESLFEEITAQIFQTAMSATEFPYRQDMPLAQQLTTIANQELALLSSIEYMNKVRMVMAECFHSFELVQQSIIRLKETEGGLQKWLQAAMDDGQLKALDSEMASIQFLGLIKAFAFWPQLFAHQEPLESEEANKVVTSAVEMFLKQYQS